MSSVFKRLRREVARQLDMLVDGIRPAPPPLPPPVLVCAVCKRELVEGERVMRSRVSNTLAHDYCGRGGIRAGTWQ